MPWLSPASRWPSSRPRPGLLAPRRPDLSGLCGCRGRASRQDRPGWAHPRAALLCQGAEIDARLHQRLGESLHHLRVAAVLAPQPVEEADHVGLLAALQPDAELRHVEHAAVDLERPPHLAEFLQEFELARGGLGPLLEDAQRLPTLLGNGVGPGEQRLGAELRRADESGIDCDDEQVSQLVVAEGLHVEPLPAERRHLLERPR